MKAARDEAMHGHCSDSPIGWSPDGSELAFVWLGQRSGAPSIWVGPAPPPAR